MTSTDTQLKATIKNVGSAAAGPFYVHAEAVTSDGNSTTEFNDQQVASLAAGASIEVDFNANVTTAGDYKITVKADEFNDIAESNEHDNSSSIKATAV